MFAIFRHTKGFSYDRVILFKIIRGNFFSYILTFFYRWIFWIVLIGQFKSSNARKCSKQIGNWHTQSYLTINICIKLPTRKPNAKSKNFLTFMIYIHESRAFRRDLNWMYHPSFIRLQICWRMESLLLFIELGF